MDEVTWAGLALTLTLLGCGYTWLAYQRRGVAAGLRGAAFTLLPVAAYLTDTLRLLTRIGDAIGDWAIRLAFSPSVWAGVILAGVSVVLFVVSGFLRDRNLGTSPRAAPPKKAPSPAEPDALPASTSTKRGAPAIDNEMAEIEALLRKRGIT